MHFIKTVSLFLTSISLAAAVAIPDDGVARREAIIAKARERRDYYGVSFFASVGHAYNLIHIKQICDIGNNRCYIPDGMWQGDYACNQGDVSSTLFSPTLLWSLKSRWHM